MEHELKVEQADEMFERRREEARRRDEEKTEKNRRKREKKKKAKEKKGAAEPSAAGPDGEMRKQNGERNANGMADGNENKVSGVKNTTDGTRDELGVIIHDDN